MTVELCLEWSWFKLNRLMIILLGIGAYGPEPPTALIASTQEVWKKRLGREVPKEEAKKIIRAFSNLVILLKEVRHEPAK